MWYLGYFDEAMTQFLADGGLAYQSMIGAGFDVQLVRSEIEWLAPLRWPDEVTVEVSTAARGNTSFTLGFAVTNDRGEVARGRTVYVVIGTDGSGKRPIPPELSTALGDP
jgi:acyl-CoA thioester hydrolase